MDSTASILASDTLINDSPALAVDTTKTATTRQSDVETTINYDAKDSLYFDVKSQSLFLYGDTHIDYGEITLDAERTDVDWGRRTIHAQYVTDSTGK